MDSLAARRAEGTRPVIGRSARGGRRWHGRTAFDPQSRRRWRCATGWLLAIIVGGLSWARAAEPAPRVLVGVNYFAGWWEPLPNKWHGKGWSDQEPDWRPQYPLRVPLLGQYNDQATMDRELAAAADHGVDFFAILWYYPRPGARQESQARLLNRGLETYLASPQAGRVRFMIEYCNAAGFRAEDEADWAACLAVWVAALRHPGALRVDGRLVLKIHDTAGFLAACGGDLDLARRRLESLRSAVRNAGLGEMWIGSGVMSRSTVAPGGAAARLFDFTATYMSLPDVEPREAEYPYATLAAEARDARRRHAADPIPWMPYLAAGWNPRPWTHPRADAQHRRFFAAPSRDEWLEELRAVKQDLQRFPGLGLPTTGGLRQRAFTIYAWNEFGEGGIVAPTRGEGAMKLEAIREVFPPRAVGGSRD